MIAKAFLAEGKNGAQQAAPLRGESGRDAPGRIAIWAVTLGAMFPDGDSVLDVFDPTGMAVITEHRGLTHSLLLLPLWALLLATVTLWILRWREARTAGNLSRGQPPRPRPAGMSALLRLAVAWGVGIGSHILLDLINSWGTMIWMPLSKRRVAWDLTFVIDLTMTAVALAPQLAAWAYARREGSFSRRLFAWTLLSVGAAGAEWLARAAGFPFSPWGIVVTSALFAILLFLPARGSTSLTTGNKSGFAVSRAAWCRAGCVALVAYLGICIAAHHAALSRVEEFAAARGLSVERMAAIPLPPAATAWVGLIRTPQGVYEARFNLLESQAPQFYFFADAQANGYLETARTLPGVQTYLWFARFPVASYIQYGAVHVVEFTDRRFFPRGTRKTFPFTFRVTFDAEGRVMEAGWAE